MVRLPTPCGAAVAGLGEKAAAMKYVLRLWTCIGCGKSNKTEIGRSGIARCEACSDVARIPSSRKRGRGIPRRPPNTQQGVR